MCRLFREIGALWSSWLAAPACVLELALDVTPNLVRTGLEMPMKVALEMFVRKSKTVEVDRPLEIKLIEMD